MVQRFDIALILRSLVSGIFFVALSVALLPVASANADHNQHPRAGENGPYHSRDINWHDSGWRCQVSYHYRDRVRDCPAATAPAGWQLAHGPGWKRNRNLDRQRGWHKQHRHGPRWHHHSYRHHHGWRRHRGYGYGYSYKHGYGPGPKYYYKRHHSRRAPGRHHKRHHGKIIIDLGNIFLHY